MGNMKTQEVVDIKNACPEWTNQELKPLNHQGAEVPGYMIAKDGVVINYNVKKEGTPLTWYGTGPHGNKYPSVGLKLPASILKYVNTEAGNYCERTDTVKRVVRLHVLVMDSWVGLKDCPEELRPYWHNFDENLRSILRPFFNVDHIDDNKHNPHVSNLQYVCPKDNHWIIKGGHAPNLQLGNGVYTKDKEIEWLK